MKDQKEAVKKVIEYIERNLEKEINLDHISKNAGYSKFYLNRIFTEQTELLFTNIYKTAGLRLPLKSWLRLINR